MAAPPPFPLAYWIVPGRLMAGCFPGHALAEIADRQLGRLLDAGMRCFVDLMEEPPRGAPRYAPRLEALAQERGLAVERHEVPVEDHDVPSDAQLLALEELLSARLAAETPVYVHCWGGRGRTGVVAGLVLMRLGLAAGTPWALLDELREACPGPSPETEEQALFVPAYVARTPAPASWAEGPTRQAE